MFEELSTFDKVIVTGPQRSGTTICAKIIAADLEMRYISENVIDIHDFTRLTYYVMARKNWVIQCPALCHRAHEFGRREDLAVVMMRRPLAEILRSQERIGWTERREPAEREKYQEVIRNNPELWGAPIARIKWHWWETFQRSRVLHWLEVHYASLAIHPLFIPQDLRKYEGPRKVTRRVQQGNR